MIREMMTLAKTFRPFTGENGTYVAVTPDDYSAIQLSEWSRKLGFPMDANDVDELHCTIMWSKQVANNSSCAPDTTYQARLSHFEYWPGHNLEGYIVAILTSPDLAKLHQLWIARGCVHSFDDYTPHVTLYKGLQGSPRLYNKLVQRSNVYRGSLLSFHNEQIENVK